MRRIVALFLLLSSVAAQERREVSAVLLDHAVAIGNAARVHSLRVLGQLSVTKGKSRNAEIFLLADGSCLRQFPGPDGRPRCNWAGCLCGSRHRA